MSDRNFFKNIKHPEDKGGKDASFRPISKEEAMGIKSGQKKGSRASKGGGKGFGFPKKYLVLAGAILIVLLYGVGVRHYASVFPRNTYVNNRALKGLTVEEAEKVFTEDFSSHAIVLTEKERTETIDPVAVGVDISVGTQIEDLRASLNPWLWFTDFFGKENYTIALDVSYDEAALASAVDSLECFQEENITAPKDAYIKAGDSEFEIVEEVLGNTVKKQKLLETIESCLSTCETEIDFEESGLYKLPKVYSTDENITKALKKANKYTKGSVTYDFKYTTESIDYQTTKDWIDISDDFTVTLDEEKVGDYLQSICNKYNTMGSSRTFTTAAGVTRNIYGGDYGWKIYFDKEKAKLIKNIKSGKDITREPVYSYEAMCRNSERDDIGDSYVEISIDAQELWLFIDGECILDSAVVTGNPSTGPTETGIYALTYKKSPDVLTGPNANGTTYESEVTYWMPFNNNQGLHDASWRDSFGGSIYKTNGSHGCVNCPTSTAATLYQYIDTGFPIIIY